MAGTDFDVGAALAQVDARIAALEAHTAEAADAQSGTDAEVTGNACCPATAIVDEQLVCAVIGREMEGCSRKRKLQ